MTEKERVDFLNYKRDDDQFSKEDFEKCLEMRKALYKDSFFQMLLPSLKYQHVVVNKLDFEGFSIKGRCKYDFDIEHAKFGGDLKSTSARTEKEFLQTIDTFSYYRQRPWYMDLSGYDRDLLIAVSKHNFKVFKVFITRDSELYKKGKAEYTDLCGKLYELSKAA